MTATMAYQTCGECGTAYVTAGELLAAHAVKGVPLSERDLSVCPMCELPFLYRSAPGIAGELPAHAAITAKLHKIHTRGYRDTTPATETPTRPVGRVRINLDGGAR